MAENRVSVVLSEADLRAVLDAIETIRTKLPFLIDLTPEQRRSLPKMGDKSRAFVAKALAVAKHNSDFLPRSFSVEEFERDVMLAEALLPIMVALTSLQEQITDTYTEVGSEAYSASLVVYQYGRNSGDGESLEEGRHICSRLKLIYRESFRDNHASIAELDETTHMCDDLE